MVHKLYKIRRNPLSFQQAQLSMPLYVTDGWINESSKHYFKTIPNLKKRTVLERIELIIKLTTK